MEKPGLDSTTFKITLDEKWFSKQDILRVPLKTRIYNQVVRILRWFGCRLEYQVEVLSDPIQQGDYWVYDIRPDVEKLVIFGIVVKETKV